MNKILITMVDTTNGEVFTDMIEMWGWPAIAEPYASSSGRLGIVLRMEKVLVPVNP